MNYSMLENDELSILELENLLDDGEFINEIETCDQEQENVDVCCSCNKKGTLINDIKLGILVCKSCGQVNQTLYDRTPEWKSYSTDGGKSDVARCSRISELYPRSSMSTTIGGPRTRIHKLHEWDRMSYKEKRLWIVQNEIKYRCRKANIIKKIEDDANIIYRNISDCKHQNGKNKGKYIIIRGNRRKSLIASCVFYACNKNKDTRSVKEIANIFGLNNTDITKGLKTFMKLIEIKKMNLGIKTRTPADYVPRFCKNLRIKHAYVNQAIQIAKNIKKLNLGSTHAPLSLASASILMMINLNDLTITKKELASSFKVSDVTISRAYEHIIEYRDILIDNKKTEKVFLFKKKQGRIMKLPPKLQQRYNSIKKGYIKKELVNDKSISDYDNDTDIEDDTNIYLCDIDKDDVNIYCQNLELDLQYSFESINNNYDKIIKLHNNSFIFS